MASAPLWPTVNASLNASSAVLLAAGTWCVLTKRIKAHMACMILACGVSIAFLVSYLLYHARVGATRFPGVGAIRTVYFTILISHTVLAVVIIPLASRTLFLAIRQRFEAHRRIARVTLPLWGYVSVTGVVVYLMLYRL